MKRRFTCGRRTNSCRQKAQALLRSASAPSYWLPHVEGLARGEGFVDNLAGESADDNAIDVYRKNIRRIVAECDRYQRRKLQAEYVFPTVRARAVDRRAKLKAERSAVRILVEEGDFGKSPFEELCKDPVAEGIEIKVTPIKHDDLFKQIVADRPIAAFENQDIVAFPHYLLGRLVSKTP